MAYLSGDGLLMALRDAPPAASAAAFERGARLVVFSDYSKNKIDICRAYEWTTPHVGDLVQTVTSAIHAAPEIVAELDTWYQHPVGFFAGRGSEKAPSDRPILVDVADVARALDIWWAR
jgi:hypothetical protein